MSHVATVDIQVTDLDALEVACDALGLELRRDQRTYAWWGRSVGDYPIPVGMTSADLGKCDHAIRVKGTTPKNGTDGPWEIGLVPRTDGLPGWQMVYDFFGPAGDALHAKAGRKLVGLKVEVAEQTSLRQLARMGYRTSVSATPTVKARA